MTSTTAKLKKHTTPPQKKASGASKQPDSSGSFNLMEYLKGVQQEWHKVTWPGRQQVIAETIVVIVVVTIFSVFVFSVDKLCQFAIRLIT